VIDSFAVVSHTYFLKQDFAYIWHMAWLLLCLNYVHVDVQRALSYYVENTSIWSAPPIRSSLRTQINIVSYRILSKCMW
jgi:hypothetical protein